MSIADRLTRTVYDAIKSYTVRVDHMGNGLKFNPAGREGVARSPQSQEKIMSRAIKHLLIGGLIIMTMGVSTATTRMISS